MSAFPATNAHGEVERITIHNSRTNKALNVTFPFLQTSAQIAANQDIRTQHTTPANGVFETGVLDAAIVCGKIADVVEAKLLPLLAKYETTDVLQMLIAVHRTGGQDTFKVIKRPGLSTRITAAFKWGAEDAGVGVEAFRAEFNIVARDNGRTESIKYRVPQAQRAMHAAAVRIRVRAARAANDQAVISAMADTLINQVDQD